MDSEIKGLILAGGQSSRMGEDKSRIKLQGRSLLETAFRALSKHISTYVSCRKDQNFLFPMIHDDGERGPAGGILAAHRKFPGSAFLVVACDLPFLNEDRIDFLLRARNTEKQATVYEFKNQLEPLLAIWETDAIETLVESCSHKTYGLQTVLNSLSVEKISLPSPWINMNTPADLQEASDWSALQKSWEISNA